MILALLLSGGIIAYAQSSKDISASEQRQLLNFGQNFVRRYQQTRDIKPLISEFFVSGFGECLLADSRKDNPETKTELFATDVSRGYVAMLNSIYIIMVASIYSPDNNGDEDAVNKLFPARIATSFNAVIGKPDLLGDEDFANRKHFEEHLGNYEKVISAAQRYLRSRHVEQSARFLKQFRKDEKGLPKYWVEKKNTNLSWPCGIGTPKPEKPLDIYVVSTPLAIQLITVKRGHGYKALIAYPPTD